MVLLFSLISNIRPKEFSLLVRDDACRVECSASITSIHLSHRWRTWHTKLSTG